MQNLVMGTQSFSERSRRLTDLCRRSRLSSFRSYAPNVRHRVAAFPRVLHFCRYVYATV